MVLRAGLKQTQNVIRIGIIMIINSNLVSSEIKCTAANNDKPT